MRTLIIGLLGVLILGGCSLFMEATPQYFYGNYYMAGDSDCVRLRRKTETSVICYNSRDEPTGIRTALTSRDMYNYAAKKERERIALQELSNNIRETNAKINNTANQIRQSGASLEQYNNRNTPQPYNTNPLNIPSTSPTIYTEGMCQGSVIDNRCIGVILPLPGYGKKCYGPIVNGECRGAYY